MALVQTASTLNRDTLVLEPDIHLLFLNDNISDIIAHSFAASQQFEVAPVRISEGNICDCKHSSRKC